MDLSESSNDKMINTFIQNDIDMDIFHKQNLDNIVSPSANLTIPFHEETTAGSTKE